MSETLAEAPYIGIERTGPVGQVTLRGDLDDTALTAAVEQVIGLPVPGRLAVNQAGAYRAVWMAPDELLLMVPAEETQVILAALDEALSRQHHMALDVSDARAVFRLTGALVAEVLAKGAPCDLSEAGCPVGTARRTHLAGLAVGLWHLDAEEWEIVCFRSFAHHLQAWLEAAAAPGAEVG